MSAASTSMSTVPTFVVPLVPMVRGLPVCPYLVVHEEDTVAGVCARGAQAAGGTAVVGVGKVPSPVEAVHVVVLLKLSGDLRHLVSIVRQELDVPAVGGGGRDWRHVGEFMHPRRLVLQTDEVRADRVAVDRGHRELP